MKQGRCPNLAGCPNLPDFTLYLAVRVMTLMHCTLSYDVVFGSEITPCNRMDKSLVVYR